MGKNKKVASPSSSDPLEYVLKAVRTGKFPKKQQAVKNHNDGDDDDSKKESFHQLSKSHLENTVKHSRIYKPLDATMPVPSSKRRGGGGGGSIKKAGGGRNSNDDDDDDDDDKNSSGKRRSTTIIVKPLDTLAGVAFLHSQFGITNPAALIFASDTNPGGSATATNAGTQEEAICRTSTLSIAQRSLPYPIPHLGVAYCPSVQTLLQEEGALVFGAVCAALRNCVADLHAGPSAKENQFLEDKWASVLACALQNGHDDGIVLGAWGVGAFGAAGTGYTKSVALACVAALSRPEFAGAFATVLFAIPNREIRCEFEAVVTAML